MTTPIVNIEKSEVPIVWLDTSIISNMTIWKTTPEKLDKIKHERIERLYNQIYQYGRNGKIICPLAEQEGEVWFDRKAWMATIKELSLGIECISLKEIQDRQLHKAMQAYVDKAPEINLSYLDVFDDDPVRELRAVLSQPFYVTLDYNIFRGADYQRKLKNRILEALNKQREKNVKQGITFEDQLESEIDGEIQAVIKMVQEFRDCLVSGEEDSYNKMGAWITLSHQLAAWKHISGDGADLEGLVAFHKSDYNRECPYVHLSCSLCAKVMIDPQPIKSGDHMDITHISTLMPFSDLFITDKHWSTFLNRQSYSEKYVTEIVYVGDTERINNFFKRIN